MNHSSPIYQRHERPAWNPGRGSYGNNLWQAYSPKLGRNIKLYSDLEYHHWILVEATPEIVTFCEQPVRMLSRVEGRDRASYIDMWVKFKDGAEQYRELKYAKDLAQLEDKPFLRRQLFIQESWCRRNGAEHLVVTDEVVHANKLLLRNWRLILSILANARDADHRRLRQTILDIVDAHGKISIDELRRMIIGPEAALLAAIFELIQKGSIRAPLDTAELNHFMPLEVNHASM